MSFWGNIASGLGGGLAGLSMYNMPKKADPMAMGNEYFNKIPGQLDQGYDPYIKQGQDPAGTIKGFQDQWHQSEGQKNAMNEALAAQGAQGAAGGMSGSPMDVNNQGRLAADISNNQMQQWLQNVLGINTQGMGASIGKAHDMSNLFNQQGTMGFQQGQQQNQQRNQMIQSLMSLIGQIGGAAMGGPMGAAAGGKLGGAMGGGGQNYMGSNQGDNAMNQRLFGNQYSFNQQLPWNQ